MDKEKLKAQIQDILTGMGYTEITFSNGEENLLVASFSARELTSFNTQLEGWTYSGIQLDPVGGGRYKIEFRKVS
jgi:hypothetical protein